MTERVDPLYLLGIIEGAKMVCHYPDSPELSHCDSIFPKLKPYMQNQGKCNEIGDPNADTELCRVEKYKKLLR